MIQLTRSVMRSWMGALLHTRDSPQRTAAAFAMGVFFGFSPFLGLHTALGVVCAFLFNLNRVAALLGVYSNLPWIMGAYYTLVTIGAARLMGMELPPGFQDQTSELFGLSLFQADFWRRLATLMRPLLWPYVMGSTVGSIVLAAIAYRMALAFVVTRRRRARPDHATDARHSSSPEASANRRRPGGGG